MRTISLGFDALEPRISPSAAAALTAVQPFETGSVASPLSVLGGHFMRLLEREYYLAFAEVDLAVASGLISPSTGLTLLSAGFSNLTEVARASAFVASV